MKFLVLGASGMAGHLIALYLKEQGHEVVGFSRQPVSFVESIKGDAQDIPFLRQSISVGDYDVVINAIGLLNKNAEDHKFDAAFLNGCLPHLLAEITVASSTRIFHMSTDCVFAGNTGPYTEDSLPDGKTFYDKSKALGELTDDKNLTFRCSIVGPDINPAGIGLLNWFMKQTGSVKGYTRALWTGITTLELAKAMEVAAGTDVTGLVNLVPNSNISKYELLGLFNSALRSDCIDIIPDGSVVLDKTLLRANFSFCYEVPDYKIMIGEMEEWIEGHLDIYPHYGTRRGRL